MPSRTESQDEASEQPTGADTEVGTASASEESPKKRRAGNSLETRKPEHYPTGGRTSTEDAKLLQTRALRMRMMGATYNEIASALGYSTHVAARYAVKKAMEDERSEDAKEARELELRRLDRLLMSMWPRLVAGIATNSDYDENGNVTGDLLPIGEWTQLMDRYMKLSKARADLMGLDAPTEIDVSHYVRQRAEAEGLDYEDVMSEVEQIMAASDAGRSVQ